MRRATADFRLRLTNTLTRRKEPFRPREEGKIKMFTCGPSVYRKPHLGNYRTFLFEDILQRYLEYIGYTVKRVINFTDVEDKTIEEARKEGVKLGEVTTPVEERFHVDSERLQIKLPPFIPRSSTTVEEAVHLIESLLEKGYAYRYGEDIFYDPLKFNGFGKLYGLDMSRWPTQKRRFKRDTYPGQRWNLGDFILWHGYREGQGREDFVWSTSLGRGRPSWNIQDPAVIAKHLGYRLDLFCGGVDNLIRHHDYTLSIMESLSGEELARQWLHGEHLVVNGSKMSKSKGNIVYPEDLISEGYSNHHIRFFLIYGHYRKKKNLTTRSLQETVVKLDSFKRMLEQITQVDFAVKKSADSADEIIRQMSRAFEDRMDDDLDVSGAFDAVFGSLSQLLELKKTRRLSDRDSERMGSTVTRLNEVLRIL